MAGDPLKGINVDAAGGASKVLRMIAEQVRDPCLFCLVSLISTLLDPRGAGTVPRCIFEPGQSARTGEGRRDCQTQSRAASL